MSMPDFQARERTVVFSGCLNTADGAMDYRLYADDHCEIDVRGVRLVLSGTQRVCLAWMMGGGDKK